MNTHRNVTDLLKKHVASVEMSTNMDAKNLLATHGVRSKTNALEHGKSPALSVEMSTNMDV